MSTSYGRSPIGYLWEIIQPVGGIALLTAVFSVMLSAPPIGKSFVLFYSTGILPFLMYQTVNAKVAQSIQFSRQLLIYPSVTVFDALAARFLLNYMTQVLVCFVLFTGIMMVQETRTSIDLWAILLSFAMAGALAFGVGVINSFLFGMLPVWFRLWTVLNRPLFLVSGALFLFEDIPEPYRSYVWYNPITHIIGQMRHGFFSYYEASYVSPIYVFSVSLTMCVVGFLFLKRYALNILND